ncbi:uncharacterized Golgi apparatus membrane protein-like protein CG5021 isoform X1 [Eurytemora carolleeae]|uniref:uncharacterized Golgi apparatus membrane protein-like protein CG5021 isoform X1 n=1 Tax=Eurytemora carolleeae TaxID=1294199 RepID=UPI000C7724A6|nr:uncharacterized Golgi apparatus membrane protein-like protein CG5021 isoform X1 [Eurytemora carolleeae]|eukprot:XP_023343354.1 uncharacterized Golgi apparatus membrane protein-like protein CG5021 isoform X1 [Eurytemora affinis]
MAQQGYVDNSSFQDFGFDENSSRIKHPVVTFFHLIFKSLALIVYLLCSLFNDSFIGNFVFVTLLLSLDFWTTKNITGRIMVGLRWWNYINDDGVSVWKFEARNGESAKNLSTTEIRIFWTGLIVAPGLWVLFFLTALFSFKFSWLILVVIGLTLSTSNLLGYLRCKMGKSDDSVTNVMSGMANQYMQKRMMQNLMGVFKPTPPPTAQTNLTV